MNKKNGFPQNFRCPSCFLIWDEKGWDDQIYTNKLCTFCEISDIKGIELIERRLDVLDRSHMRDFPETIKHMAKHIPWKENEDD